MTIQEKLNLFAEKAARSVDKKRRETAKKIQETIKESVREAELSARQEMTVLLKVFASEIEKEANKKIHSANLNARQDLMLLRKRLAGELFAELEEDLRAFTLTSDYQVYLQESIKSAQESFTGDFEIEIAGDESIGGFRLNYENGRAVADFTLLARLEEIKENGDNIWHKWAGTDGN